MLDAMSATAPRWLVALLAGAFVAAACTTGGDDSTRVTVDDEPAATTPSTGSDGATRPPRNPADDPVPADLDWRDCDGGECAELAVPRDYDEPDGPTIDVALIRVPASEPDRRIGSLLANPGGPGASGVDFVRDALALFPATLRERFDIVGFDPRGTGDTIPVDCTDSLDSVLHHDYSPDSALERADLQAGVEAFIAECEMRSGDVLPYVATQDTVRDMDRIRAAVGDDKLTYLGYSYGTYLGALYADFFPDRVRALLLDGAVDPELSALESNLQQAQGFEAGLNRFLDACADDEACDFFGGRDTHAAFDRLVERVDQEPLPARDGREVGPNELDLGVAQSLYLGELGWDRLAAALAAATNGDGTRLLGLADDYTGRLDDGSFDSLLEPFWAIGCVDGPPLAAPAELLDLEAEFEAAAPRLGVTFLWSALICSLWPEPPAPDPGRLDGRGADPVVVVGTTGDPATPFRWAEGLVDVLEPAVLVEAEGGQHTSTFFGLNPCVDEMALRYLVGLEVPDDGTLCSLP